MKDARYLSRWKSVEMCIHDETRSDCVSGLVTGQLIKGQEQGQYVVLLSGRADAGSPATSPLFTITLILLISTIYCSWANTLPLNADIINGWSPTNSSISKAPEATSPVCSRS